MIKESFLRLTLSLVLAVTLIPFSLAAQEPEAAGNPQNQNRSPRQANPRRNVREFLGLGPAPDAVAAKRGEPLFKQNCGGCHGEDARGAQGPNLVRSVVVLHDENDEEIGAVIKSGRAQAGMPPFPQLSHDQVHDIAQFLKLQVELTANRGTYGQQYAKANMQPFGDAQKGAQFFQANCVSCHSASGDLAKVATKFPESNVMQARFLWPASKGPAQGTVVTASGQTVTGTLLKADDFDIELRDDGGVYHYWPRNQVTLKTDDKLEGHRVLLPKYTDADIHNLTAYLETLK